LRDKNDLIRGMLMTKAEKIKFIQYVIDFCALDLTKITPPSDSQTDLFRFIYNSIPDVPLGSIMEMHLPVSDWSLFISGQKQLRDFLNWFVDLGVESFRFEFEVPYYFSGGTSDLIDRTFLYTTSFWDSGDKPKTLKLKAKINKKDEVEKKIISLPIGVVNFLQALDELQVDSLLRCLNCNNIFFNPTRRKKKYCSLRCQNTAAVQRLRKKEARNKNQH
jgi:hypothetical protein